MRYFDVGRTAHGQRHRPSSQAEHSRSVGDAAFFLFAERIQYLSEILHYKRLGRLHAEQFRAVGNAVYGNAVVGITDRVHTRDSGSRAAVLSGVFHAGSDHFRAGADAESGSSDRRPPPADSGARAGFCIVYKAPGLF